MDGTLDWQPSVPCNSETDEAYLLRLVRTVRNNLFHGGKYPSPVCPDTDIDRNREMIRSCLVVLEFCLSLDQRVGEYFMETA